MKRIVHVIHCCGIGGAEIFVKNLIMQTKALQPSLDIELWVIYSAKKLYNNDSKAIEYEKQFIKDLTSSNIKVIIFDKNDGLVGRIDLFKKIRNAYKEFNPKFIFCHLETVTFHIVSALFFKKVTIFETIHTDNVKNVLLHKCFLGLKLNKYITISSKVNDTVLKKLNCSCNKTVVIKNGINISDFNIIRKFTDKYTINIVSIGRLIDVKNHIFLLETIKELNNDNILDKYKFNLKIYGDGILKQKLSDFICNNDLFNCQIMGPTNNVPKVLFESDIYVLPSKIEGYSISLIEALASGISIICTDVGGNKEIVSNNVNGFIIDSCDKEGLKESLIKLITNYKLRKEFYNNTKLISEQFSINATVYSYLDLCDK